MANGKVKYFCSFDGGELVYHIGMDYRCKKCGLVYSSRSESLGINDPEQCVVQRIEADRKRIEEIQKDLIKLWKDTRRALDRNTPLCDSLLGLTGGLGSEQEREDRKHGKITGV